MWMGANTSAALLAARLDKIAVAGSDSHTISGAGRTYTEVPGARTAEEFFAGLRAGKGRIRGEHGSYSKLTADVFHIVKALFLDKPWALVFSPLVLLVPCATLGHWINEIRFCRKWSLMVENGRNRSDTFWGMDSTLGATSAG